MGFSEYFTRAFPELLTFANDSGILSAVNMKKSVSIIIILVFTIIHLRGIENSAKVQNWLTILKILLVSGLIFIGLTFGNGSLDHFSHPGKFQFNMNGWKSIGLSLMWIMFAYSGWNASTYIGSEIKKPEAELVINNEFRYPGPHHRFSFDIPRATVSYVKRIKL